MIGPGELARDHRTDAVLLDLADDPQLTQMSGEVADLGDGADVVDLSGAGEVERDADLGVTHAERMHQASSAKRLVRARRMGRR